ncbi:hypothetical protein BJX99DRAFT_148846 [Aspergillus californicus]
MMKAPIVVGIDMGTCGTAVSYSRPLKSDSNRYGAVFTTSQWPSGGSEHKVPTRIAYRTENQGYTGFGNDDFVWGFRVRPGMIASSWFKLFYNSTAAFTDYSDQMINEAWNLGVLRLPFGKTNIDVTADFLTPIFESVLRVCAPEDPARQPLILCMTFPITWPEAAISSLEAAARRAGFGGRPMAAMYHVVPALATQLRVGEGVILCDVGGGTTDICSIRITHNGPPIQWEKIQTNHVGGRCAGSAVDCHIYSLLLERFGPAFQNLPVAEKAPGSPFMNTFERVKRVFAEGSGEPQELPLTMDLGLLPNSPYYDIGRGMIRITQQDLYDCFNPVITEIIELVNLQFGLTEMQAGRSVNIRRLVFVGGLLNSSYVRGRLGVAFRNRPLLEVVIPHLPQLAVTKGAALHGMVAGRTQ